MDVKVGAAYVRVSTDEQTEYSPDSQLKLIRDYAKREGYIIPDEYVFQDDGISGKKAEKRPAFRLMIATAKEDEKPFDAIFVWKYSRFARNQEEAIMYKNLLKKKGVEVKSISEPSSDSPFASLIERIIEWMDEYYLINLAGEVKRGLKEKSQRGEPTGKPPFGYDVSGKMLIPNENAKYVEYIFEQYASGKSYRQISYDLNAAGITLQNGKPFNINAVCYILKNPAYVGKLRWSEDEHGKYTDKNYFADLEQLPNGKHLPLIEIETWDKVQKRLASHSGVKYKREDHPVFMLKGLVRCGSCGSTLVESYSKKYRNYKKLQCCKYNSGKCKVSHFIPLEKANEAVIEAIEQCIGSNAFTFAPKKPSENKLSRDWDKLIGQEEMRLKRAKNALLDGAFTSAEYKEIKTSVEENIAKLKDAKGKDVPETIDEEAYKKKVVGVLSVIKSPDVSGEAKNMALRSIIDKIVFNKPENTFDIYFCP